jgi:paired amphipathic helix protein Sin3a
MLGSDDASVETRASGMDRWREYVDSYLLCHQTEWMPGGDTERKLFLHRYVRWMLSPIVCLVIDNGV